MQTPFLQTKLHIPAPQPGLVNRPHLIELLDRGAQGKLTLVSAPAGFGKSTLVSQWASQAGHPVAWLSLESADDELTRFLSYIILALNKINQRIGVEALAALQASRSPQIDTILGMLTNELSEIEGDIALILDDYHVISSRSIHEALLFLIDHSPPNIHLLIVGRADPFLPLARYRARGELVELRMKELRFSSRETERYLHQFGLADLKEEDVVALETRTEGWISGIHLAALSMLGHETPSQFIAELAGDNRYIIDYLVDEVLAHRPEGTRDFLIKTSILERMNAQLCDAVTGSRNGRAMLTDLEQANLFIVPMDHRRHWYRYHRLFADLLHRQLEETCSGEEVSRLHLRASQWYEKHGYLFEPIRHSLMAEDDENATRLIEKVVDKIFATGQLVPLTQLYDRFPQAHLLTHPVLCMIFSWAWLATGHLDKADACLRTVEKSFDMQIMDLDNADADSRFSSEAYGALIEVAVIQAQLAFHNGHPADAIALSQLALRQLEGDVVPSIYTPPMESRCVAYFTLGLGYEAAGNLDVAEGALETALHLAKDVGNIHIVSIASAHLAKIHRINGDLRLALQICEQGIRDLQEMVGRSPMAGSLLSEWGLIAYEQNDLDLARERFDEAISLSKLWGFWEALVPAYTGHANIHLSQGDTAGASRRLEELQALGKDQPNEVTPAIDSTRAKLWIHDGDIEAALAWAQELDLDSGREILFSREDDYLLLVRVLLAAGRIEDADRVIGRLIPRAEEGRHDGRLIELLTLRALSLFAQNETASALKVITRALRLAEPSRYMRVFLDEGSAMLALLQQAAEDGVEPEYVSKLAAALADEQQGHGRIMIKPEVEPTGQHLLDPLSDRELEVLRLLRTELSGPEIAQELSIALSTVRTHTHNIYGKLGVSNRRSAIRRAGELEIY